MQVTFYYNRYYMKKNTVGFLVIVVIILGLFCLITFEQEPYTGQAGRVNENTGHYPVIVMTYNSNSQPYEETFYQEPQRVIAVWQSSIETMLALGLEDKIVAALGLPDEVYLKSEYREAYRKIPYRDFRLFKCETALTMDPDFIITCWSSAFSKRGLGRTDFWHERHVNTYVSEMPSHLVPYRTIAEEYRFIRDLGKIFHVESRAEQVIGNIQREIDYVLEKVDPERKPQVMIIQFMGSKIKNWGANSLQADIVTTLNGQLRLPTDTFIGAEHLIELDPEIIFVVGTEWEYHNLGNLATKVLDDRALQSMKAVKQHRVYVLPLYAVNYSATRLDEGIRRVAEGMYPDLYSASQ